MSKKPWPKLSETLSNARDPRMCQRCGGNDRLETWIECDDHDHTTRTLVILCNPCSSAIIEPHPRLYERLPVNKPMPGAMAHLCGDCKFRQVLRCTHPDLKENGGTGLMISAPEPLRGFIDGPKYRGPYEHWNAPPGPCRGKEVQPSE